MADISLEILKLWHLRGRLNLIFGRDPEFRNGQRTLEPAGHSLFGEILARAKLATERWGGSLYLVYLPNWNRYVNGSMAGNRERARILEVAKGLGISVIDLEPAFKAHVDPLSLFAFRRSLHYNDEGHQLIAKTVLEYLSSVEITSKPDAGEESLSRYAVMR